MPRPPLAECAAAPTVNWLFLDLNSYFASVEQETRPELRGRPVAVVPLDTPNTVCIAASYEAKARGVKTGTKVRDARRLCPEIALVESRPQVYVDYHHAILTAVETCVPVTTVMSIDEAACQLTGLERNLPNARALAGAVKAALREVGATLRCSIGLAPNRYLAKVAADMQKPDGLTVLLAAELPQALYGLRPADLPGIGRQTQAKLSAAGIATMEQLCALSQAQMGRQWGSVAGERLYLWLRGADFHDAETERKSLGKQHVLAPQWRNRDSAFAIAKKLLHNAATDLRGLGLWAGGVGVAVQFLDDQGGRGLGPWLNSPSWKNTRRIDTGRDIFTLQEHLAELWASCPERAPILVHVWMFDLLADEQRSGSLFEREHSKREAATAAMDALNRKFGKLTVHPAGIESSPQAAPARIPFGGVARGTD